MIGVKMQKLNNPLNDAWFVEPTTTGKAWINSTETKWEITGPREIIVNNNKCECEQELEQKWRYCPNCGGKLSWE